VKHPLLTRAGVAASVAIALSLGMCAAQPPAANASTAAAPATLSQVITQAESVQGKTLAQTESALKPSGIWANYNGGWCAWFVTDLLHNNGVSFTSADFSVPTLWSAYSKAGRVKTIAQGAKPTVGAVIFYGTTASNLSHVGLVAGVSTSGLARTVEGNTGFDASHPGYLGGSTSYTNSKVNEFMAPYDTVYGYAYPMYGSYNSMTQSGATGSAVTNAGTYTGFTLAAANPTEDLWTIGASDKDWYAELAPGSSPAIATVPGGDETVEVTSTGDLWSLGPAGSMDWELAVDPKSTPAVTSYGSGYEAAVRRSDGNLETVGTAGSKNWGLQVRSGTSPAIVALAGGGYVVAYEDKNGDLHEVGTAKSYPSQDLKVTAAANTSPAIAAASGGFEVAYQTTTNVVATIGHYGAQIWSQGMLAGTSPAIAAQPSGFVWAVQTPSHVVYTSRVTETTSAATATKAATTTVTHSDHNWGFATRAATSPTVLGVATGGYVVAAVQSNGELSTMTVSAANVALHATVDVTLPAATSPSIAG
jgi:hypothetical protein